MNANAAERLGLVSEVFPDDEFVAQVMEVAADLASLPRVALAGIKSNLNYAETAEFATYLEEETATFMRVRASKETEEAANAFLEKRAPKFDGE